MVVVEVEVEFVVFVDMADDLGSVTMKKLQ
jgi:hypothetical protein